MVTHGNIWSRASWEVSPQGRQAGFRPRGRARRPTSRTGSCAGSSLGLGTSCRDHMEEEDPACHSCLPFWSSKQTHFPTSLGWGHIVTHGPRLVLEKLIYKCGYCQIARRNYL